MKGSDLELSRNGRRKLAPKAAASAGGVGGFEGVEDKSNDKDLLALSCMEALEMEGGKHIQHF